MDLALFDEEHGYYSTHLRTIGAEGDFATAPSLSRVLARAIASSVREHEQRSVIEVGPGAGHLARALLKELRPSLFPRRGKVRCHLVERSPKLQRELRESLGRGVMIHASLLEALRATEGNAYLVSNELVDAFPVRIFQRAEGWRELFLALGKEGIEERWGTPDDLPDSSLFDHEWPEGQRIEVHESYRHWLAQWEANWKAGVCLTIDYGGRGKEIYHRLPRGTLRGYYHHERFTGPELYTLPGRRDLTCDVNFDDLLRWGEALGLKQVLVSQSEFLQPFLDQERASEAEKFLADPHGAGSAFKVLLQTR